ncbi:MAG: response regulator, partial [Treponema sp.]|nr:response regulator [Treponema sp.]
MNNERVLIAMLDDDPAILRTGANVLSPHYSIATFSSADKLFGFLKHSLPALILLDVMMPGTDGYETIKTLKASERTRGIPVIFLSGMTGADEEFEGLNLGA